MDSAIGATLGPINYGSLGGTWGTTLANFQAPGVFTCSANMINNSSRIISEEEYAEPTNAYTISAWMYIIDYYVGGTTLGRSLVKKAQKGTGWVTPFQVVGLLSLDSSNQAYTSLRFSPSGTTGSSGANVIVTTRQFPRNVWMHVAATYDGQYLRLYRDGQLLGTSPYICGQVDYQSRGPWVIGTIPGGDTASTHNMLIHDVRIESIARSTEYLLSLYKTAMGLA